MDQQQVPDDIQFFSDQFKAIRESVRTAIDGELEDKAAIGELGKRLDEFLQNASEGLISASEEEWDQLSAAVIGMQEEVRKRFQRIIDKEHETGPPLVTYERSGGRGPPTVRISEAFLRNAAGFMGPLEIARFLKLHKDTVKRELERFGIIHAKRKTSYVTDDAHVDDLVRRCTTVHPTYGSRMIKTAIRMEYGFNVALQRVLTSMDRLGIEKQRFGRRNIPRRPYSVPGPNSLWHHDGQHRLIRWGIVIHAFIDGFSRFVVGIRASSNNKADTVLNLFLDACEAFRVPVRVRGDHGTENLRVAAWMDTFRGLETRAYIWGRSVHNTRIERLWRLVTMYVGQYWYDLFYSLEEEHGLDIDNLNHRWLLHLLFLDTINADLARWAAHHNAHKIQLKGAPPESPESLYLKGTVELGVRGSVLPADREPHYHSSASDEVDDQDIASLGVGWEELTEEELAEAEDTLPTWSGPQGIPENLNEVPLSTPGSVLAPEQVEQILQATGQWRLNRDRAYVINAWTMARNMARMMRPNSF